MKWFNTPLKTALASLLATEVFLLIIRLVTHNQVTLDVIVITGLASFIVPYIFSHGVTTYKEQIEHQNQELQSLTSKLQNLNDGLTAQNKELDEFAQTVAHDLKTPLSAILGFAEILASEYDDLDPETITNSLKAVSSSARKALRIVDELLLLARVSQVGKIETSPLNMASIVEEAQRRLAQLIVESDATMHVPATWPVAIGHAGWVEEVWVNYISNAIKYGGPSPMVTLGSRIIKQPDGDIVLFAVKDSGSGLSEKSQAQLFTPFTRLGQPRSKGYGLGLSIVRRIVSKLGGEVGVESKGVQGQGCVFYFTLPKYIKNN